MMRRISLLIAAMMAACAVNAQIDDFQAVDDGTFAAEGYQNNRRLGRSDSVQSQHKIIPRGLKVWTIDERFGNRTEATPDTLSEMYMNTIFTTGLRGEYNSLGNLGSPRENRIFIDREDASEFFFLDPYGYAITQPGDFHFTSSLSPITNLSYNTAGNRTNGEDHFKALFAVNAGRKWGFGFKFDYLYGRGYYSNQSASHLDYSMWGSYLGERYQAHLLFSLNHQKVAEGGGITNDAYITHPETFNESFTEEEIPTQLTKNWNRNDNQHAFFNHRYSLGFFRKVPMTKEEIEARKFALKSKQAQQAEKAKEKARRQSQKDGEEFDEEAYDRNHAANSGRPDDAKIVGDAPASASKKQDGGGRITVDLQDSVQMKQLAEIPAVVKDTADQWMKEEYVPVTSFIHTMRFDNYRRIYQAYATPDNYYKNDYYTSPDAPGDSIYDRTRHWSFRNTFAVALLEGFNKWAKAGLKAFASYELRHYELPSVLAPTASAAAMFDGYQAWNQHDLSVGGQLLRTSGNTLHYDLTGEVWVAGANMGQLHLDGHAELNFPLLGDTVQLAATAFFHRDSPSFYMDTFRSRHFWWDNNTGFQTHTRLLGEFALEKTRTRLRVGYDMIKNYTYFGFQNDRVANNDNYLVQNNEANVRQHGSPISLLTIQLQQDFRMGILNWQNVLTFQKSSEQEVLPLPAFNAYSNLFIRFRIAKVLDCDFGVDGRYFTKYYAPEYIPGIGAFGIQETEASRTEIGNYPLLNVYANFKLQHTRFFVMYSHVNSGSSGDYFFMPHYPLNQRIFRFGVSWNFFN